MIDYIYKFHFNLHYHLYVTSIVKINIDILSQIAFEKQQKTRQIQRKLILFFRPHHIFEITIPVIF